MKWPSRDADLRLELPSAFLSLTACAIIIWGCFHGMEPTDEGYYLNWMRDPFIYRSSYSQFGFLLHPFYVVTNGHLILIRLIGFVTLAVGGAVFFSAVFKQAVEFRLPNSSLRLLLLSCSCSVMFSYFSWIPTPNYNSLNLLGMLIGLSGWIQLIRAAKEPATKPFRVHIASGACALGFSIVALVKPPTAAVLTVAITLLTIPLGWRVIRHWFVSGIAGLLLFVLTLLLIDGGPSAAIERYLEALRQYGLLQSHHDWAGIRASFQQTLAVQDYVSLASMTILGSIIGIAISRHDHFITRMVANIAFVGLQVTLFHPLLKAPGANFGSAFLSLGIATLTGTAATWFMLRHEKYNTDRRPRFLILTAVLIAPVAFAIGTNSSVWWGSVHAGTFWIAAIILLVVLVVPPSACERWVHFIVLTSASLLLQITVYAIYNPYRISLPLWQQSEWAVSATSNHVARVDRDTASYFHTLLTSAKAAGFKSGMPIIDMTGMAPISLYVLNAEAVGLPWIFGGYAGSEALAKDALLQVEPEKLRHAWILTAPAGHRPLPLTVLREIGLRFPDDYEEIARARTGYASEIHVLWRPIVGR